MLLSRPTLPEGAAEWGVDVSFAQGDIDWAKAKADGVDFAILRLGYGAGGSDRRFVANVQGCKANGIKFGVYLYSYAWDASTATSEAEWTLTVSTSCRMRASSHSQIWQDACSIAAAASSMRWTACVLFCRCSSM